MPNAGTAPSFEILEHTADIGLRATGLTFEELFENAAWGLAEILDVQRRASEGQGRRRVGRGGPRLAIAKPERGGGPAVNSRRLVDLRAAPDLEALLVDWMNELILLTEEGKACLADVHVETVNGEDLRGRVDLVDCGDAPEGTELKAATYHQLAVRQVDDGWEATVYFDV